MANLLRAIAAVLCELVDVHPSGLRTRFLKAVKFAGPPVASTGLRALKPGKSNGKLGKVRVQKGPATYRGRWIYALTLEERATCPSTCQQLTRCYGDNMPFAIRYVVDAALYLALRADLDTLDAAHPEGYIVRLHVLGDFKNLDYVAFWADMLAAHPLLSIYGYTHWPANSRIGSAVADLVVANPGRFSILRSDGSAGDRLPLALVVTDWADTPAGVVKCPEMTGQTDSCATCGLCMNGRTSVSFLDHGKGAKRDHSPSLLRARTAAKAS